MSVTRTIIPTCPAPVNEGDIVQLAHGSGGRLMHKLLDDIILPAFNNEQLARGHDGAVLDVDEGRIALTTDSYVVKPLFFQGGDIGILAVNGTVNDLAMCGARPLHLTVSFIIEEGLPVESLKKIVHSMAHAAKQSDVGIVTGDTKVVERGKGDGLFINTAGVGVVPLGVDIAPQRVEPGDAIILNGDIARHGIAVLAARADLDLETNIDSDTAPLADMVAALIEADVDVHCLRDLTRGGLAGGVVEIAESAELPIHLDEGAITIRPDVAAVCELMGFDPLHVANEGRFIAIVQHDDAKKALEILHKHPDGQAARVIGSVSEGGRSRVSMKSRIGGTRLVEMLSGDQLPRIC